MALARARRTNAQCVNKRARIIPFINSIIPPFSIAYVGPILFFLKTAGRYSAYTFDDHPLASSRPRCSIQQKGRCLPSQDRRSALDTMTAQGAMRRSATPPRSHAAANVISFFITRFITCLITLSPNFRPDRSPRFAQAWRRTRSGVDRGSADIDDPDSFRRVGERR